MGAGSYCCGSSQGLKQASQADLESLVARKSTFLCFFAKVVPKPLLVVGMRVESCIGALDDHPHYSAVRPDLRNDIWEESLIPRIV